MNTQPPEIIYKPDRRRKLSKESYASIDWSKRDCELANEHGVTRERMRQLRRELGESKSPQKGLKKTRAFNLDTSLTATENAQTLGLRVAFVYYEAKRLGLKLASSRKTGSGKRVDWSKTDWTLKTSRISKEIGVSISAVCHNRKRYAPDTAKRG